VKSSVDHVMELDSKQGESQVVLCNLPANNVLVRDLRIKNALPAMARVPTTNLLRKL
jgi:hypothetical protein